MHTWKLGRVTRWRMSRDVTQHCVTSSSTTPPPVVHYHNATLETLVKMMATRLSRGFFKKYYFFISTLGRLGRVIPSRLAHRRQSTSGLQPRGFFLNPCTKSVRRQATAETNVCRDYLQRDEFKKVPQDMSRRVGSLAAFIFVHLITIIDGELNLSEYLTNKNNSRLPIHQMSWFGSR
jgi:hypothetical protein